MEPTVSTIIPKVMTLDYKQFFKKIYGNGGMPLDGTVFDRIRYFSHLDFHWMQEELKGQYTVLELGDKIIGIAKVAHYKNHKDEPNVFSITFFSIDLQYRNRGYSRIMAEELFRNAKEKNLDLDSSRYTVLGKLKLQALFNEMANKYGVKFQEQLDYMHDGEHCYDENLVHINEKSRFEELKAEGAEMVLYHPKHIANKKQVEPEPVIERKRTGVFSKILEKLK
jgi:predicted acetyltransferase